METNNILQQPEKIESSHKDFLQQDTQSQDVLSSTLQVSLPPIQAGQKAKSDPAKCSHILENGKQCGAFALSGKDLCFSHDPASREAKIDAVTRGGQSNGNKVTEPLTAVTLTTPQDVVTLLAISINEMRTGQLAPKTASILGFLCGYLLKAMEVTRDVNQKDEVRKTFGVMPPKGCFK